MTQKETDNFLLTQYSRFLDGLGHESIVYIAKNGAIDHLIGRLELKREVTEDGYFCMGYYFKFTNK